MRTRSLSLGADRCTASTDVPADSSNTCVTDSDCPRDTNCLLSQCRTKVCEPGALRCNDNDLKACTLTVKVSPSTPAPPAATPRTAAAVRRSAPPSTRCFEATRSAASPVAAGCSRRSATRAASRAPGAERPDLLGRTDPLRQQQTCNTVGNGWVRKGAFGCAAGACAQAPCQKVRCAAWRTRLRSVAPAAGATGAPATTAARVGAWSRSASNAALPRRRRRGLRT